MTTSQQCKNLTSLSNDTQDGNITHCSEAEVDRTAVISTIVFAIIEMTTCGGLVVILCSLKRKVWKYASLVQNGLLVSILIKSVLDLLFRLPRTVISDDNLPPAACAVMRQLSIFSLFTIYFILPLISCERLVKIVMKRRLSRRKIRHIFSFALVATYALALILVILPVSGAFNDEPIQSWCHGTVTYGYGYIFLFTGFTCLIVTLTLVFSISLIRTLKKRSRTHSLSENKRKVMKRAVTTAIALTVIVFLATLPYALTTKLRLLCDGGANGDECTKSLDILFTICQFMRMISFSLVPVIFLVLNKALRRRIWSYIRKRQPDIETVHISTSTSRLSATRVDTRVELQSRHLRTSPNQPIDLLTSAV